MNISHEKFKRDIAAYYQSGYKTCFWNMIANIKDANEKERDNLIEYLTLKMEQDFLGKNINLTDKDIDNGNSKL